MGDDVVLTWDGGIKLKTKREGAHIEAVGVVCLF